MPRRVQAIDAIQTPMGRWILVLPAAPTWGWSGSRFVEHLNGVPRPGEPHVSNWATKQEALDYAAEHLLKDDEVKTKK